MQIFACQSCQFCQFGVNLFRKICIGKSGINGRNWQYWQNFFYPKKVDSIPKTIDIQIATFAISASAFFYLNGAIFAVFHEPIDFQTLDISCLFLRYYLVIALTIT